MLGHVHLAPHLVGTKVSSRAVGGTPESTKHAALSAPDKDAAPSTPDKDAVMGTRTKRLRAPPALG